MAIFAKHTRTAREEPYHFAGRREELALLHDRLDSVIETGESLGGAALVTGVPGVGKTQLGRRFAKEARARTDATVRHLAISAGMVSDEWRLFMAIGGALECEDEFRAAAETAACTSGSGRNGGPFGALLLATNASPAWRDSALIPTVDELQGVRPAGMAVLEELHLGLHGCPILLVGIGLQNTLRGVGIAERALAAGYASAPRHAGHRRCRGSDNGRDAGAWR